MQPQFTTPSAVANTSTWRLAYNELRRRYPHADLLEIMDAASQCVDALAASTPVDLEARWQRCQYVDAAQSEQTDWRI